MKLHFTIAAALVAMPSAASATSGQAHPVRGGRKVKLIAVIATISLISTQGFAAAQGGGKPRTCRQEVEACMKRLLALRDPVTGVAIQRDDAARFCNSKFSDVVC